MALLSLLTKQTPFRTKFGINGTDQILLLVDAVINETINYSGELTSNPVEDGTEVNDHFRPKPVQIQIEGIMSESPMTLNGALNLEGLGKGAITSAGGFAGQKLAGGYGGQLGGLAGGLVGARLLGSTDDPAATAFKILEEIFTKKVILTLTTKRKRYDNMIMIGFSIPRTIDNGKALKFSAQFQELHIVKGQSVELKNLAKSSSHSAAAKSKLGNQTPTPETGKKSSLLFKAIGGLF